MKRMAVHICSFEANRPVTSRTQYEAFKKEVLAAGRFSVFEATANARAAAFYDRLCRDKDVVIERAGFPWTNVLPRREGHV